MFIHIQNKAIYMPGNKSICQRQRNDRLIFVLLDSYNIIHRTTLRGLKFHWQALSYFWHCRNRSTDPWITLCSACLFTFSRLHKTDGKM